MHNKYLKITGKIAIVAVLCFLLIDQGKLNFSLLIELFNDPLLLAKLALVIIFGSTITVTLRWFFLLRAVGANYSFWALYRILWISNFFTIFLPGLIAGDGVKVLYLLRNNPLKRRSPILSSMILDRFIGLFGIVIIAALAAFPALKSFPDSLVIRFFAYLAWGVLLAMIIALAWLVVPIREEQDLIKHLLDLLPLKHLVNKVYKAFSAYRGHWGVFFWGILLSCLCQLLQILIFYWLTVFTLQGSLDAAMLFFVLPFGELVQVIPLTPSGIGVGHYSYDYFYAQVGLSQGADVFNLYLVVRIGLGLLGGLPFLLHKKEMIQVMEEAEQVQQAAPEEE